MKWVLGAVLVILLVSSVSFYLFFLNGTDVESIPRKMIEVIPHAANEGDKATFPYDAYFFIYTDGIQRSFQAAMYKEQSETVYIPAGATGVVRVEEANVTWDDFFKTLPFSLDQECLTTGTGRTYCDGRGGGLLFVLNGEAVDRALFQPIQKGDELLVSFGSDPARIEQELSVFETR